MNADGSDMRLLECSDHPLPQLADGFDPNAVGLFLSLAEVDPSALRLPFGYVKSW